MNIYLRLGETPQKSEEFFVKNLYFSIFEFFLAKRPFCFNGIDKSKNSLILE